MIERLRAELRRAQASLKLLRPGSPERAAIWQTVQTLAWAVQLPGDAPPMRPTDAAVLGPTSSGGLRYNLETIDGRIPDRSEARRRRDRREARRVRSALHASSTAGGQG